MACLDDTRASERDRWPADASHELMDRALVLIEESERRIERSRRALGE
jgi:hypothetical protein